MSGAACRDAVLRAAWAQDRGDWPAFGQCFTADAELVRPDGQRLAGREAIVAAYAQQPAGRITRHLVVSTLVDRLAAGEARALSQVLVWSGHEDDAPGPHGRPAHGPQRLGEFDDRLRRGGDGRWRIVARRACFVLHR